MEDIYTFLLRWSEVWPWLIPLTIFFIFGLKERILAPVVSFCGAAFVLTFIANYAVYYPQTLPPVLRNNNIFYNILSVLRALMIGWYIISLPQLKIYRFTKVIYGIYLVALFINFIVFEYFLKFSSRIFAGESVILLMLCITYFLGTILDEETDLTVSRPEFLICAGISLYESINYFIYLFFNALLKINMDFGFQTMKISKYSNILVGVLIGIALYQSYKRSKTALTPALNSMNGQ